MRIQPAAIRRVEKGHKAATERHNSSASSAAAYNENIGLMRSHEDEALEYAQT